MAAPTLSLRAVASVACAALLFSSCDTNSNTPQPGVDVGADGATLTIDTGILAGLELVVPPDSIDAPTRIYIAPSNTFPLPGVVDVGPSAALTPQGTSFDPKATLTLPFYVDALPPGTGAESIIVERTDNHGRTTPIEPVEVDLDAGTVTIEIEGFSAYWVAIDLDLPNPGSTYFPLLNGDRYEFDNGLALGVFETDTEPNLTGTLVNRAVFDFGPTDLGVYLRPAGARILSLGDFSSSGDFQEVLDLPLVWMPSDADVGSTITSATGLLGYSPFGTRRPAFDGRVVSTSTVVTQGRLRVPLGQFDDVIELVIVQERRDADRVSTVTDRVWLARGVGPVQIELGGTPRGGLVDGLVGGNPVLPQ